MVAGEGEGTSAPGMKRRRRHADADAAARARATAAELDSAQLYGSGLGSCSWPLPASMSVVRARLHRGMLSCAVPCVLYCAALRCAVRCRWPRAGGCLGASVCGRVPACQPRRPAPRHPQPRRRRSSPLPGHPAQRRCPARRGPARTDACKARGGRSLHGSSMRAVAARTASYPQRPTQAAARSPQFSQHAGAVCFLARSRAGQELRLRPPTRILPVHVRQPADECPWRLDTGSIQVAHLVWPAGFHAMTAPHNVCRTAARKMSIACDDDSELNSG